MELAEFEKQLRQGRGGVALFIRENLPLPTEYRDALLYACLHDLRFEHWTEEGRGFYLHTLITISGDIEFYREKILATLPTLEITEERNNDLLQLMNLVRLMAQTGDVEAKTALYTTYEQNAAKGHFYGGDELTELDGVEGLIFLVDRYDDAASEDLWDYEWQLSNLEERDGEATIRQELEAKCAGHPLREDWLKRLDAYREERKATFEKKTESSRPTYEDLKQKIAEKGVRCNTGRWWGKRFTEEERLEVANDLLGETDLDRRIPLLRVFDEVPFPLDPEPLFMWAKDEDKDLSWAALWAIGSLQSPKVRAFALEIIEQQRTASPAVKMLLKNYELGDEERIIVALERITNPNYYHSLGMDVRDFERAHPSPLSTKMMTLLYRDNPCSFCRNTAVERLVELNALPAWIRDEAMYDAAEHTRKLASGETVD